MKISLNWIKDYVPVSLSAEALAYRLTLLGLEVVATYSVGKDTVFEMEITPNRPDCLSLIGVAREISAATNKTLKLPKIKINKIKSDPQLVSIVDKRCARYVGTVIRDVRIGKSPDDIKSRLEALGIRSVNNIVDITNFSLFENGQPLHAFDYDKLDGGKIVVRAAKEGEKLTAIDGKEYKLDPSILVIADASKPVAIAGVMGGQSTEVTSATKNILLESAYFDPITIRRAARKLGLSSDSSYRFERGVNFEGVLTGANRASALILYLAGGKAVARGEKMIKGAEPSNVKVSVNPSLFDEALGCSVPVSTYKAILQRLGCVVSSSGKKLKVIVPIFRKDLKTPVDLVEEVARVIGYDTLPSAMPVVAVNQPMPAQKRTDRVTTRTIMTAQGFSEVITFSMMSRTDISKTKQEGFGLVKVVNPLSADLAFMRPSLLPSFLPVALTNINRGQKDLRLFEIGKIYTPTGEKETLGMMMTGNAAVDWRRPQNNPSGFFDLKGTIDQLMQALSLEEIKYNSVEINWLKPGESAGIFCQRKQIGWIGNLHQQVLSAWDIKQPGGMCVAEISLEEIYSLPRRATRFKSPSDYPAIVRDISLALNETIPFTKIEDIIHANGGEWLSGVKLIEEYRGEKISAGQRGLVLSLSFQSSARTLREDEVNSVFDAICRRISEQTGAVKR